MYNENTETFWCRKLCIKSLGIIQKSWRILPIFLVWFSVPENCADTSRLKFDDTLTPKCVNSSCKNMHKWISKHFGIENYA